MFKNCLQILPCFGHPLRLTGASDWSSETISVYLNLGDSDEPVPDSVKDALSSHISTLCTHTFLNAKPPRPTVSRWTGVAAVCRWCLKLALFHQCLGPVLQALTRKKDSDESTARLSLDNDVGDSGFGMWCAFRIQQVSSGIEPCQRQSFDRGFVYVVRLQCRLWHEPRYHRYLRYLRWKNSFMMINYVMYLTEGFEEQNAWVCRLLPISQRSPHVFYLLPGASIWFCCVAGAADHTTAAAFQMAQDSVEHILWQPMFNGNDIWSSIFNPSFDLVQSELGLEWESEQWQ